LIDSSPFNQKTLARFLNWIGIRRVEFVGNDRDVLVRVDSFQPDLVMIDIGRSEVDGIELCRRLRRNPQCRDLPILIQTTISTDQIRAACFHAGANDILTNPINPGECIARVRYHLERRSMVQELRRFRERVEKDLHMARAMQHAIVPERGTIARIAARHRLSIDVEFESCNEIGGDFWTLFEIDDQRVGLFIADFSGHGIPAAINTFRLHALIERIGKDDLLDPSALLSQLSRRLQEILPIGQYATAFYAVLDTRNDLMVYAAAGSTNPVLGTRDGFRLLDSTGFYLGVCSEEIYCNQTAPFPPGSFLFLYSDALIEGQNNCGKMLGEDGLTALIEESLAGNPGSPLRHIIGSARRSTEGGLHDDLTAVWIGRS
jgi:sigma-B regulation protein RsbU (phosphoserine phosphatase)